MSRWSDSDDVNRGDAYDSRWKQLEADGQSIHGEADLIEVLLAGGHHDPDAVPSVLDAGCGTGRVAIELARRGFDVVGVDLDPAMLDTAREKAPHVEWHMGDLAEVQLGKTFDVVALPGNVMIFLAPHTEGRVLSNLTTHLRPAGRLITGFQLGTDHLSLPAYDAAASSAGLTLEQRWSTWGRDPFEGGDYVVSLHRRHDTLQ